MILLKKNIIIKYLQDSRVNMIKEFSNEIIEKLKYYLYHLINTRNGQTFYVSNGGNCLMLKIL